MPSAVNAWIVLARAEKAVGNTEGTLRAIGKAAELAPDSATMLMVIGYSYINLNRIPQAVLLSPVPLSLRREIFSCNPSLDFVCKALGRSMRPSRI